MRLILALLFTVIGGAAWGQCTTANYPDCPGAVIYNGPLIVNPANPIQGNGSALTGLPPSGNPQITTTAITANATLGTLPANGYIQQAVCRETSGHSVIVSIGSTSGASDVASAFPVSANGTDTVVASYFSSPTGKNWFSATAPQTLFIASVSWGGASLNCNIVYQVGP